MPYSLKTCHIPSGHAIFPQDMPYSLPILHNYLHCRLLLFLFVCLVYKTNTFFEQNFEVNSDVAVEADRNVGIRFKISLKSKFYLILYYYSWSHEESLFSAWFGSSSSSSPFFICTQTSALCLPLPWKHSTRPAYTLCCSDICRRGSSMWPLWGRPIDLSRFWCVCTLLCRVCKIALIFHIKIILLTFCIYTYICGFLIIVVLKAR